MEGQGSSSSSGQGSRFAYGPQLYVARYLGVEFIGVVKVLGQGSRGSKMLTLSQVELHSIILFGSRDTRPK